MIVEGKGRGWEFVSFPNLPQPLDLLLHIVYLILASLCVHLIIKKTNNQPFAHVKLNQDKCLVQCQYVFLHVISVSEGVAMCLLYCMSPAAGSSPIHLGRTPDDECTTPITCTSCPPFEATSMELQENATLRVSIGPSGQERGYMAITGEL